MKRILRAIRRILVLILRPFVLDIVNNEIRMGGTRTDSRYPGAR
jgi:hypothetical protein